MKISAFLMVAALTCSASFAAQNSADRDRTTDQPSATAGAKADQADQADASSQSMGAAGSHSARRARMDEAYDNWKSRQK